MRSCRGVAPVATAHTSPRMHAPRRCRGSCRRRRSPRAPRSALGRARCLRRPAPRAGRIAAVATELEPACEAGRVELGLGSRAHVAGRDPQPHVVALEELERLDDAVEDRDALLAASIACSRGTYASRNAACSSSSAAAHAGGEVLSTIAGIGLAAVANAFARVGDAVMLANDRVERAAAEPWAWSSVPSMSKR